MQQLWNLKLILNFSIDELKYLMKRQSNGEKI